MHFLPIDSDLSDNETDKSLFNTLIQFQSSDNKIKSYHSPLNINVYQDVKMDDEGLLSFKASDFDTDFTINGTPTTIFSADHPDITQAIRTVIMDQDFDSIFQDVSEKNPFVNEVNHVQIEKLPSQQTITNREIIQYNQQLINKFRKVKIRGKNRYSGLFIPRFKLKMESYLQSHFPDKMVNIREINKIKGIINSSTDDMTSILLLQNLFETQISTQQISEEYTSSNQILLDGVFPVKNFSGSYRKQKLNRVSEKDFVRFLASYQMISKFLGCKQILRQSLTFQNCRHYNLVTERKYNSFCLSD